MRCRIDYFVQIYEKFLRNWLILLDRLHDYWGMLAKPPRT